MSYKSDNPETEAATIAALAQKAKSVEKFDVGGVEVFNVPGSGPETLEKFRQTPLRHKGEQSVADVESFLKLTRRYQSDSQLVRISQSKLRIEAIFNYGNAGSVEWGDHSAVYKLDYDRKLTKWRQIEGVALSQTAFMEFLEDRLEDVTDHAGNGPTQSALSSVISDLQVTTDSKFKSTKSLSNGNFVFECSSEHKPSVEVPKEFFLGLPVFEGSKERFVIPIRMRYKVKEGVLSFTILFHNWQAILDAAWKKVTEEIIAGLPEGVEHINVP